MFKFGALLAVVAVQLAFAADPLDLSKLLSGLPLIGGLGGTVGGIVGGVTGGNGTSVAGFAALAPVLGLVQAVLAVVIALLSSLLGGLPGGLGGILNVKNSPLPLVKSSLSAVFSREASDFMSSSELVHEQLRFLNGTLCADESLWATIAGNPEKLPMPGGFDAKEFLQRTFGENYSKWWFRPNGAPWITPSLLSNETTVDADLHIDNYVISRYQQWQIRSNSICRGRYYRLSCVFGVDDLPTLVKRHELLAHKLYLGFQPASFLCLIQEIRRRSIRPSPDFVAARYHNLPDGPIRDKY
ncbi:hypothetical protein RB195_005321 [Necator americanus]|uniref:Uncharacterized protein n=1 Tax=Necator americanus TaxID=51031 RepID=A0ABR1BP34_NECAM